MKNIRGFLLFFLFETFQFLEVKFPIYLYTCRRVFIMILKLKGNNLLDGPKCPPKMCH